MYEDYQVAAREELGPLTLSVVQDDSGIGNPRENSNVGVIVGWNDRYTVGEHDISGSDVNYRFAQYGSVRNFFVAEYDALAETILPVEVGYEGKLRVGNDWDQADGAIFATPASIEETGCPPDRIDEALRGEVKEYSQWASGEVYGWVIEKDGAVLDSVWGYIGDTEYPMSEARATAEYLPEYRREVIGAFAASEGLGL